MPRDGVQANESPAEAMHIELPRRKSDPERVYRDANRQKGTEEIAKKAQHKRKAAQSSGP